ncbi:MAG TPA: DUF4832 domain-containing protein, partial [Anaerolineales bacterium]|nr:DUF4832 domain-containing protein [Anaerolineales bacterium]
ILNLSVTLENKGFASIINERFLYIVLFNGSERYEVKTSIDPRTWQPGTSSFDIQLHVPSNVDEGEYQLALWLPDAYETLHDDPLYAIQFANENTFDEATGYNILGIIKVDKNTSGNYQHGEEFEVIK